MRPRQRRESGEQDPFRSRLEQIIDLRHPLARRAADDQLAFPGGQFGAVYMDGVGRPTRAASRLFARSRSPADP